MSQAPEPEKTSLWPFWWQAWPLHRQLRRLRWFLPLLVFALAALHQLAVKGVARALPPSWHNLSEVTIYSLTGSLVAWIGLTWIAAAAERSALAEARLRAAYAELESNHQKLLTLYDLGQRVAAADDEQAVLELAAQAPLQLTEARASSVVTFDEERNRLKLDMAWGLSERYLQALRARLELGVDAVRCRTCTSLKTHVSSDCPLFVGIQSIAQAEGIGSLICLPIAREQERVGIISAYFPNADGPPEDQVRLLNILGGAIAAMLESMRVRARQVGTIYALDQASQAPSMDTLGEFAAQVLDIVMTGWEAQAGGLFLYQENTHTWTCRAGRGLGESLNSPQYALALELVQQAHAQASPLIVPDLGGEAEHRLLSAAAAPLISEGETLGAIFLAARRRRVLNERHTELLRTISHQTALAIRNAQLYNRLGQMAILEERYRLSREIHDGLAQTLGYLGLQAERLEALIIAGRAQAALQEVGELRRTVRAAYVDVREAIDGLRLSVEQPGQLAARLRSYVHEFSRQSGIAADFKAHPADLSVDPAVGLQLLRIAQEALTNVRKHAMATQVYVRLMLFDRELELSVTDNGLGFPPSPSAENRRSYGLTSMRERAQSLGGSLAVATRPGQGTRIIVTIPVDNRP